MAATFRSGNYGFSLSVEDNLDEFKGLIEQAHQWAIPYAAASAMSKTAYAAAQAEKAVLPLVFDRPTPLTLRAVLYRKADKDNLTYSVFIRDEVAQSGNAPERYLSAQILGGERRAKPYEQRLRSIGVLGANQFTVPAKGYPLDRFGNVPAGVISSMLSQLGARRDVGTMQNTTAKSKARRKRQGGATYFVPAPGSDLPRGVYERLPGHGLRAVLIFVRAPTYGKRYAFGEGAIDTAKRVFDGLLASEFSRIVLKRRH